MPDWSYHTSLKYGLNALPRGARASLVLSFLGFLGRWSVGRQIIRLLGHMDPHPSLETNQFESTLKSPVALGRWVDNQGLASQAFNEFGIGYQEVNLTRWKELAGTSGFRLPVVEQLNDITKVHSYNCYFRLSTHLSQYLIANQQWDLITPLTILSIPASESIDELTDSLQRLQNLGIQYIHISRNKNLTISKEYLSVMVQQIVSLDIKPILGLGIEEPQDILDFKDLGAEIFVLNSEFAKVGPGFPKRLNAALTSGKYFKVKTLRLTKSAWFYGAALGVAMFVGGILAWLVAHFKVLLPYDETQSQLSLQQINELNEKILHFLVHDRVTLAGTMLSIGILYITFSMFSMRRGEHWAKEAVAFSALFGFLNFFAFLSYGYFDVFHAFVTACLLQIFLIMVYADLPERKTIPAPSLKNDRAWNMSLWSQAMFVTQGLGLILAGLVITFFGSTSVFVPQDLEYLGHSADLMAQFHDNLVPLIAHDRCTFGGMLGSAGICILLSALHGFERGRRWLWWTYLSAGLPPYLITFWVHHHIGYVNQIHLLPVYIGMALLFLGLALGAPYLFFKNTNKVAN